MSPRKNFSRTGFARRALRNSRSYPELTLEGGIPTCELSLLPPPQLVHLAGPGAAQPRPEAEGDEELQVGVSRQEVPCEQVKGEGFRFSRVSGLGFRVRV